MLTLSRRQGETLLIGEDITVTILAIRGNTVKVAIDAPGSVSIVRKELKDVSVGDSAGACVRDSAGMGGGLGDADSDVE